MFYGKQGCVRSCGVWGEWNGRIFTGVDRDPSEVWSLVCFHVSLWALVSKPFELFYRRYCITGEPSCTGGAIFVGWIFYMPIYSFISSE